MLRPVCLLATAACCALAAAGDLPMQTYLQPESLTGCVLSDGAVRLPDPLPTQQAGEPIAIEAEAFTSVEWQNEKGRAYDDPAACGGKAVAFAQELVYHFTVTTPGFYWYWQRAWIPVLGSWNHAAQIDDAMPFDLSFGTRPEDKAEQWFWIGGPKHWLKAGVHTLAIRNLHNGKRLDRVVLTPDEKWQAEGIGPAATPIRETNQGEYVSRPLEPIALRRWVRVAAAAQGKAEVTVKRDGGFVALPPQGDLSGLTGPLQVRVTLQREPGEASPTVRLGAVKYLAEAGAFHVLRNAAMELLLERKTGRICGLRDVKTGRRYLPDGAPATLFELETKAYDSPEITRLSSDDATLVNSTADGKSAQYVYGFADGKLQATVVFALQADWTARATLRVDNRSDRDVIAVHFPRLAGAQCGEDGTDDVICFPGVSGQLIPRPGRAGTLTNVHPMRATTGFCDVHDRQGGLTLAPVDYPMVMSEFTSEPDPGGESVLLRLARRDRVPAGTTATFNAVFGVHPGDWHTAADWYRQWFDKNVGQAQIPAWVRDSDGWVTTDDVEDMAGLGFTHMQMWGETGYGGCPTYYYPNPRYRSEAGFKELARQWRALGGHLGVYFHGNGTSRSYIQADKIYGLPVSEIPPAKRPETWDWFVRNWQYTPDRKAPERLDMTDIKEPAEHEEYPAMAWQSPEWRGFLRKWALDIYLREYGLDTPYWDTLACYESQGYNPFLKQNGEGDDAMARLEFLRQMQADGRKLAPGFYQTVEGGSELLGLVGGQLESNFVRNLEVARYTHPDQIYYVGHSNGWWNPPQTEQAAAMAFWLNTKMDIIRLTPGVMEIVRARRWLAPWLYHSRFMDNLGLNITSDRIRGALHVNQPSLYERLPAARPGDGALIATFMNWQKIEGQTATIDVGRYLKPQAMKVFLVTQGAEPVPLQARPDARGQLLIDIPVTPVSAVLFLERPEAATPVVQAWQDQEKLRVRVFDPAEARRSFRVALATPEGKLVAKQISGKSGDCVHGDDIAYVNFPDLTRRAHADLALADGKLALRTRALVAPRFADPDFEDECFDTARFHTGRRSLRIDPGGLTHYPLELVPGRRYRISFWVLRQEQVGSVMGNVHLHLTNQQHGFGWEGKPNEWTRVETIYEMKGPEQPHLYLYNWQGTTKPAWFDGVQVEELPAEAG